MRKVQLIGVALVAGMLAALFGAAPAFATSTFTWGNGLNGTSFGTHDWISYWGVQFASREGVTWINAGVVDSHSSDPDYIINDRYNHNYDRWHGQHKGNADNRVKVFYNKAVSDLKAGRRARAMVDIADMGHYFADMNQPFHTQESKAETADVHGAYEAAIDRLLRSPGAHSNWLHYDGYQHVSNPRKFAQQAAAKANKFYSKLLSHWIAHGVDKTVYSITTTQLNRAVNGLADLITSIDQDAATRGTSKDLGADVGVASDGTNYFAISQGRIQKFNAKFVSVATTTTLASDLPSITVPVVGNGCFARGHLYVPVTDATSTPSVTILVFDAATLQRVAAIPTSMTVTASAIAFNPSAGVNGTFYAASTKAGDPLRKFDGATWAYLGNRALSVKLKSPIGALAYHAGALWAGTGATWAYGRVYRITTGGKTRLVYTHNTAGWLRGFAFRGSNLEWLLDNGAGNRRVLTLRIP